MNLEGALRLAGEGKLYPSVILHGSDDAGRRAAALELSRILICERTLSERPCNECRHCRRTVWPGDASGRFHPDFHVLDRDLRTSTSVDAARTILREAQVTPFEAAGQIFVVTAAESLTAEAANAFLKTLEEPHTTSPRNFLLLAPSQFDLLPTLRSRSQDVYLGAASGAAIDSQALAEALTEAVSAYAASSSRTDLFDIAQAIEGAGDWKDPRSRVPWETAASAVAEVVRSAKLTPSLRRRLLALAEELLSGPDMRLRGIQPQRILEGLVDRELGR